MRRVASWEEYLARLCLDRWSLEPASTIQIMMRIESLAAPGRVNDHAVAVVLQRGGVAEAEADFIAPRLCTAINA